MADHTRYLADRFEWAAPGDQQIDDEGYFTLAPSQPDPRVDALVEAINSAARWFDDYERQHRAKLTSEGNLKADTNAERAAYLRAALAQWEAGK